MEEVKRGEVREIERERGGKSSDIQKERGESDKKAMEGVKKKE